MNRDEIREWATGLIESDKRVNWQKSEPVTGQEIARIVRAENPEATDADLDEIARIINNK
jgi:hypothetical protein